MPPAASAPKSATKVVHAVCTHDCPDSCGVLVTVDELTGRAIKVQGDPAHPVTRGFLCGKVARYLDRVYSPDRLLYPMRRKPGIAKGPLAQGREAEAFERITWDEALTEISAKLSTISKQHGPESILPYSYAGTIGQLGYGSMDRRFFYRLGASQLDRTICASAGGEALLSLYGVKLGTTPQDFAHAGLILAWGANIHGNNVHLWPFIEAARRNGARLIVIDPYRTRTAALADEHLAIHPGTDTALALAIMHVLFRDSYEDRDYLETCTQGWQQLRDHALKLEHSPYNAARITGIEEAAIERLARACGQAGKDGRAPAVIRANYGIQRSQNGGTAMRAVLMLPLITGSWKHRGGGALLSTSGSFPFNSTALQMPELMQQSPLGRAARMINMNELGNVLTSLQPTLTLSSRPEAALFADVVERPAFQASENPGAPHLAFEMWTSTETQEAESTHNIHALFVYNCNAAAVAPDSNRVLAGLRRADLFTVVHEQFFTDTTDYADIVLPATTFLEAKDVMGAYGHLLAQISQQAIAPLGEARSNVDLFAALGRRMFPGEPAFEASADDLIDAALHTHNPWFEGITREALETHNQLPLALPQNDLGETLPFSTAAWFRTPSGRAQLLPLPEFKAPTESRANATTFPLEFLPRKADNYMNTTFANLPTHQQMERRTAGILEMHAHDATARSIAHGDQVIVWNARGRIRLIASIAQTAAQSVILTEGALLRRSGETRIPSTAAHVSRVAPGVVAARLDWQKLSANGSNVNALTSQALTDLGGGATFYSTLVEVERVDTSAAMS